MNEENEEDDVTRADNAAAGEDLHGTTVRLDPQPPAGVRPAADILMNEGIVRFYLPPPHGGHDTRKDLSIPLKLCKPYYRLVAFLYTDGEWYFSVTDPSRHKKAE